MRLRGGRFRRAVGTRIVAGPPAGARCRQPHDLYWKGEQYVAIGAGGHSESGTTIGDSVVAFRLARAGEAPSLRSRTIDRSAGRPIHERGDRGRSCGRDDGRIGVAMAAAQGEGVRPTSHSTANFAFTLIVRACGRSSTPRLLCSIIDVSGYWVVRSSRTMTAEYEGRLSMRRHSRDMICPRLASRLPS
jgi:hypothetical protein